MFISVIRAALKRMSSFKISSGITSTAENALPQAQVLIVGRNRHLKGINFNEQLASKLNGVDSKLFTDAINQLPNSNGSVPLYLNLAKIVAVSDEVSRCNVPANSIAIFKELKGLQIANGTKNLSIVLYADYEHLLASVSAIARVFPTYSRKTAKSSLENVNLEIVVTDNKPLIEADVKFLQSVADSIRTCCHQVDSPCNELHSEAFLADAQRLISELKGLGYEVTEEVIKGDDLLAKGFGGIYHVGKAARNPPIFARFTYKPKDSTESIALVGKGIVYDTGGMQIKTKTGMPTMKRDMAGAAALLGSFCALVKSGFKQELHCLLCIAENNISPDANKPDDIIVMLSGKTVEITNTDAEGRLVLSDGVYYARQLGAKTIIDMATLTGAQAYMTGKLIGAVLTNKEEWERSAIKAGKRSGDLVYPMPYCPDLHFSDLKSSLADMKNSNLGKMEGPPSAIAGLFIASHIDFSDEVNWLHFDIAAPSESGERATAFGVPLICSLLSDHLDVPVAK